MTAATRRSNDTRGRRDSGLGPIFTAADLMKERLPELKWAIKGLVPHGLTLLVEPPQDRQELVVARPRSGSGLVREELGRSLFVLLVDDLVAA